MDWKAVYPLWTHRWHLRQRLFHDDKQEVLEEIGKVKDWLEKENNQNSECGWSYLVGCIVRAGMDLEKEGEGVWQAWKQGGNRMVGGAYIQLSLEHQALKGKHLPCF